MRVRCRLKETMLPPPCRSTAWHESLFYTNCTVVWVVHIDDVEVGVVNSSSGAPKPHFVFCCLTFGVECGFGDIKERVDE